MTQNNNARPRRRITPEQRRRILERRRRQQRQRMAIILSAAMFLILAIVVIAAQPWNRQRVVPTPADAEPAISLPDGDSGEAGFMPEVTAPEPTATPEPTQDPNAYVSESGAFNYDEAYIAAALGKNTGPQVAADLSKVDPQKLNRWPEAKEGFLPLITSANTFENVIAITVDDCNQADNLRQIVQCALDNGGQLTIFPIGKNLMNDSIGSVVKWAWENGMEIENHTYNHAGMYHGDDENMTSEMWYQNAALSKVLGVNYQEHFFRPKGGDERNDQRVHAYASQMGMQAIAVWSQDGSVYPMDRLLDSFGPGQIYLFHTTNNDVTKLLELIPKAVQAGYRLVTLNEMFGLPDNETSQLTDTSFDKPALQPFQIEVQLLKKTTYSRAAAVVQQRLNELGWLSSEADGVFGQSSYMATGYFQIAADITADGIAGAGTQAVLFSENAPAATAENKAKVAAKIGK